MSESYNYNYNYNYTFNFNHNYNKPECFLKLLDVGELEVEADGSLDVRPLHVHPVLQRNCLKYSRGIYFSYCQVGKRGRGKNINYLDNIDP